MQFFGYCKSDKGMNCILQAISLYSIIVEPSCSERDIQQYLGVCAYIYACICQSGFIQTITSIFVDDFKIIWHSCPP